MKWVYDNIYINKVYVLTQSSIFIDNFTDIYTAIAVGFVLLT